MFNGDSFNQYSNSKLITLSPNIVKDLQTDGSIFSTSSDSLNRQPMMPVTGLSSLLSVLARWAMRRIVSSASTWRATYSRLGTDIACHHHQCHRPASTRDATPNNLLFCQLQFKRTLRNWIIVTWIQNFLTMAEENDVYTPWLPSNDLALNC